MMFVFLLLLSITPTFTNRNNIIKQLRIELLRSKSLDNDMIIPFLCMILPSPQFMKVAADQDFISSILYELGFGVLGVKQNSWAARYQANPHKNLSCFATLYSIATSDMSKNALANYKKMIRRCCLQNNDL